MKSLIIKRILLLLVIVAFAKCNSDNQVLATYKGGEIKRKQLRSIADMYELDAKSANKKWQSNVVKHLVMLDLLKQQTQYQNLVTETSVDPKQQYIKDEIIVRAYRQEWKLKQDSIPENVYEVEAVTLKDGNINNGVPISDDEKYKIIAQFRNKALKDPESLEDIAKNSAGKLVYENLGPNSLNLLAPQVNSAVLRVTGQLVGGLYQVVSPETAIYTNADEKSPVLQQAKQYDLLSIEIIKDNPIWLKVNVLSANLGGLISTGYVLASTVKSIEKEDKKLSQPIKTIYGWQFVYVKKIYNAKKEEFAKLIQRKDKKGAPTQDIDPNAYWKGVLSNREYRFESSIFTQYGLSLGSLPKLDKEWLNQVDLLSTETIKITKEEFSNYILVNIDNNPELWKTLTTDYPRMMSIFEGFLKNRVLLIAAKQAKAETTESYTKMYSWEMSNFMAQRFFERVWFQDLPVNLKDNEMNRKNSQERQNRYQQKEKQLLETNQFKLLDDKIQDGKL